VAFVFGRNERTSVFRDSMGLSHHAKLDLCGTAASWTNIRFPRAMLNTRQSAVGPYSADPQVFL